MAESSETPIDQQLWAEWQEFCLRMVTLVMARNYDVTLDEPVTKGEILSALNANYALVEGLLDHRWFVMQIAKEAGASWSQIGAALGMTKQGAQDYFRRHSTSREARISPFHDERRVNAVLSDEG
jgi:hypothetical protein